MIPWFVHLNQFHPIAYAILILAVVIAGGLVLGNVRVRGIGLGSAGVLFAGLLAGQFGQQLNPEILGFLKEFGLVLFVFTIGLQLGPGFLASLRAEGLRLNLLASAVVLLGCLIAALAVWLLPIHPVGVLGAMTGAVTNTPSLGALQQALDTLPATTDAVKNLPAIAYAVAYPGGILGIIAALLLLRWWLRIDLVSATKAFEAERSRAHQPFERRTLLIDNPHLDGVVIGEIPGLSESSVTVARIRHRDDPAVSTASPTTVMHTGDRLLLVGTRRALDHLQPAIGSLVDEDLVHAPGPVVHARLVVTANGAVGELLGTLRLGERFNVTVTRVLRSEVEMNPAVGMRLHFGDVLNVVGEPTALAQAGALIGNQPQALNHTYFAPIFLGIALGVIAGMLPIALPGLPEPVRLGLAGGPLLIAILLGRIGSFGRLIWHMPEVANRSFRELGIALFLACVGLLSAQSFVHYAFSAQGLVWIGCALAISMIPLLIVCVVARLFFKENYTALMGLLAGSCTDPPALAFANGTAGNELPGLAYATVYPLTMLLRVVGAQIFVLLWLG